MRLIRDNVVIHEGKLSTLKRFKDEVSEVQAGQECGMAFANYQDMRDGDVIECFHVETIAALALDVRQYGVPAGSIPAGRRQHDQTVSIARSPARASACCASAN